MLPGNKLPLHMTFTIEKIFNENSIVLWCARVCVYVSVELRFVNRAVYRSYPLLFVIQHWLLCLTLSASSYSVSLIKLYVQPTGRTSLNILLTDIASSLVIINVQSFFLVGIIYFLSILPVSVLIVVYTYGK